ncbi:NAD(P)-dependent oxidoreductase [Granulosicoccus sp. 3-233]|uniref:NAD(P)-dependent oxidoreductase n=1 Tax=Granulosicoccus sp. 3-233 TaxID=3417969 RepID=UPI003D330A58
MPSRPTLILDVHWRKIDELFSAEDLNLLKQHFELIWAQDEPIPSAVLDEALPRADVLVAASPQVDADTLARATRLHTVVEVSGAFPDTIDYALCAQRGVQVLSCAPGFRESVAEMALAMTLAAARGLVTEHEHFRTGTEHWLNDNTETDFTVFNATVGFIGYGSIARATHDVLRPFNVTVKAFDPWLDQATAQRDGIELVDLETLMSSCRVVYVTAAPTRSNHRMVDRQAIASMARGSLFVVISRAHLIDFDAVVDAAAEGRIKLAIDVFPEEPLAISHPLRTLPEVILSPHRAAAVEGGRQLIGRMLVSDLLNKLQGKPDRQLQIAQLQHVEERSSVDDAHKVAEIARERN